MSGWLHSQHADTLSSDNASNKFTSPLFDRFTGAGRRRSAAAEDADAHRRAVDAAVVKALADQGIDLRRLGRRPRTAVDLASRGQRSHSLGTELRESALLPTVAHRRALADLAHLVDYCASEGIETVAVVVLRPRGDMPRVGDYRAAHQEFAALLGRKLDYAQRHVEFLSRTVHAPPRDAGERLDLHAHVAFRDDDPAAVAWLLKYLHKHFEYDDEDVVYGRDPAGAAWYLRGQATSKIVGTGFAPEHLAEFWRQISLPGPLRWSAHYGGFAEHRRQRAGLVPILADTDDNLDLDGEDAPQKAVEDGLRRLRVLGWRPRAMRPARCGRLADRLKGDGLRLLGIRMAWLDGELRPVLDVEGWSGPADWSRLANLYDLEDAVAAARAALGLPPEATPTPLLTTRPTPESSSPAPSESSPAPSESNTPAPGTGPGTPVWPPPGARRWGPPPRRDPSALDAAPF